ncbi:molybdopterin oxidoreductase [Blautia sp. An249]|nr:FAD-dependent oxidoreductase [Blautia sp. An249]OUO76007.1 molybdopterin oxidoreductase [Blautia sp. An249]
MNKFRLNIDGKECLGIPGQTILEVAKENDIVIPTLCYDERTEIYGACGLCVVEVEGNPKLCKACATQIAPNMVVRTKTDRVIESRKTNLELLLSNHRGDCRPPCVLACPAQTDCQGYVGLIANGRYEEAIELIKDKIPLPASIGRVCPHPCETACRRGMVDEPVSIAWLKRFAADTDMFGEDPFMPEIAPETGKNVAIIGGGPYGLSMAYFLRQKGHEVTIYEAMPKLGGMLRYGIPEYRLPKEVLDEEIALIERMGVTMVPNTKIGKDISFETIKRDFDAVCIGIGAWVSTGVRCKGEDSKGVIGGIDFLRKVVRNESIDLGENVAIVGGGNTAMDACRTAVRLGAKKVYNIYRRTKDEMPADMVEIEEAEEEGVIFLNLTNPLEIVADENGKAKQMVLQVMKLGEPDASGRRAPIPVEGETKTIDVDTVILAIGQRVNPEGFDGLELTRKNGIVYDPETFMTQIPGVFAGGDCGNDKISIAVESIADAKKGSQVVDSYLNGETIGYKPQYTVKRTDLTPASFEDRERMCRPKMEQLSAEERKNNFTEVVFGYDEEQAQADAARCLECGCHDYFECKLIHYANQYNVEPDRFAGDVNLVDYDDEHPFILRDPNKCILCDTCVRVCDEVMGVGALGLVKRGFDTVVKPALEMPLAETGCISCGQCVSCCPTGALQERLSIEKPVPLETSSADTICSHCSVGCSMHLETYGDMLIKAVPDKEGAVNKGLLCGRGKWGFDCSMVEGKLLDPVAKNVDGQFEEVDYHDAFVLTAKKTEAVAAKYGKEAVAVAISDRYTNEEAYVMKKLADSIGAKVLCFNNRESGLEKVLGVNASPNTIDELLSTEVILVVGFDNSQVMRVKLSQAAKNGAKVVLVNPQGYEQEHFGFAYKTIYTGNDLGFLKAVGKALVDMGKGNGTEGYEEFAKSVEGAQVCDEAKAVAELYAGAKKAMIVFQQNLVTTEAAVLLADLAVISGHIGSPRDGILQLKAKNNSQGLIDLGITAGAEAMEGVKALLVFGEDPDTSLLSDVEFMMVCDTHMTKTAEMADVVIPGTGFASADGTYTNTERRLQAVVQVIDEDVVFNNWEVAAELAHVYEVEMPYDEAADISEDLNCVSDVYRNSYIGEIYGGVLNCENRKLVAVADGTFVAPLKNTDNLTNMIDERLPH